MKFMKTIVIIARRDIWEQALKVGEYTQSTIDSTLSDVGFIHCSFPDQTIEIANRRFTSQDDLQLLFVDVEKVKAPIKYEGALSGRVGTFPHIYGALNTNAVYSTIPLTKGKDGKFIVPNELQEAQHMNDFNDTVKIMANTPPISNDKLVKRKRNLKE
jgi:uncharacterized protein (DUF952 family)